MFLLLTSIIYLLFISMGLPDSLLGAAWPSLAYNSDLSFSHGGIISLTISGSTIISTIFSYKLIKKFGTGKVSAMSVLLTSIALMGFSLTSRFWILCILAIPYGLGAGAVDVAINDYVALNYSSKHMKRLHCFWSIGAALGSYIMGYAIKTVNDSKAGYSIVSVIQLILTVLLFSTLFMWRETEDIKVQTAENNRVKIKESLLIKGVKPVMGVFFGYCALESTAGLWAGSYLAGGRGFDTHEAAAWASMLYIGITLGRFICGLLPEKANDIAIIRIGEAVIITGIIMMLLVNSKPVAIVGLFLLGLGASPIYPTLIHTTPERFGRENSTRLVGLQMASAYMGSAIIPPLFGVAADFTEIKLYPVFLIFFVFFMIIMTEVINKKQ